ncbi:MAG: hypothetical protein K0R66_1620 [Gammaproteobacteria bacterium]|jgi:hypothetical protein|nr:hypothetical protein [Gammaproteobacteria bacterium]
MRFPSGTFLLLGLASSMMLVHSAEANATVEADFSKEAISPDKLSLLLLVRNHPFLSFLTVFGLYIAMGYKLLIEDNPGPNSKLQQIDRFMSSTAAKLSDETLILAERLPERIKSRFRDTVSHETIGAPVRVSFRYRAVDYVRCYDWPYLKEYWKRTGTFGIYPDIISNVDLLSPEVTDLNIVSNLSEFSAELTSAIRFATVMADIQQRHSQNHSETLAPHQ